LTLWTIILITWGTLKMPFKNQISFIS
jgi:hypothetical protein